jgi:hypothetical protein
VRLLRDEQWVDDVGLTLLIMACLSCVSVSLCLAHSNTVALVDLDAGGVVFQRDVGAGRNRWCGSKSLVDVP